MRLTAGKVKRRTFRRLVLLYDQRAHELKQDEAMPHQFIQMDPDHLEGVWLKSNGRKFCAWRFDSDSGLLKASRGVVVRTAVLQAETKTLDELKAQLPQMALDLARAQRGTGDT